MGQIQGHGERDEVSIVKLRSRSGSGEGELWGRYKVMENGMRSAEFHNVKLINKRKREEKF